VQPWKRKSLNYPASLFGAGRHRWVGGQTVGVRGRAGPAVEPILCGVGPEDSNMRDPAAAHVMPPPCLTTAPSQATLVPVQDTAQARAAGRLNIMPANLLDRSDFPRPGFRPPTPSKFKVHRSTFAVRVPTLDFGLRLPSSVLRPLPSHPCPRSGQRSPPAATLGLESLSAQTGDGQHLGPLGTAAAETRASRG
jgi:hypothetical protein